MAAVQLIGEANKAESAARIDTANLKVNAAQAKLEGAVYGMNLSKNFNQAMGSDAVMAASQGRRGGSVQAIADASLKQYNWDMDFAEMGTEIRQKGYNANISAMQNFASNAQGQGIANAAMGMYNQYNVNQERTSLLAKKES